MQKKKRPIDTRRTMRLASGNMTFDEEKIAKIAKILELESYNEEMFLDAIKELFRGPAEASLRLSARELAMCKATGVSPASYLATKQAIRARSVGRAS